MQSISLRFSETVRILSGVARGRDLSVPVFRSPPHLPDADRSLRRSAGGDTVVSVRLSGRPFAAVQADLIDGLLVVNETSGAAAQEVRRELWNALVAAGNVDGSPALAAA